MHGFKTCNRCKLTWFNMQQTQKSIKGLALFANAYRVCVHSFVCMKTKTLTYILLGILFTAVSCKKDDSSVGAVQKSCTLNKITYDGFPMEVVTDGSDNITNYGPFNAQKSGDSLLFKAPGSMNAAWYILYDNLKRPIKYESTEGISYTLTYNNQKEQPQKIVYWSSFDSIEITMLPTYNGNNISQLTWITDAEELILMVDYYLNKSNTLSNKLKVLVPGWKLDGQFPFSFAMMFNANLVKSITLPQTGEGLNYNYQFDENGNLTQEKLLFSNNDSLVTDYGYTCK